MSSGGSTKVIIFALLANLGIAVSKFVGASLSKSTALFAEAIHSLVDCTNQVLLLVGQKKSQKPPSETHPLGYGREAFFWSFVVAIMLFSMGGLFAIYEGWHKLHEPEALHAPWIGLGILLFGILLEAFSFHACLKEVRQQNPYPNLWEWFRKTTSSELLVIFTEDAAALAGLVIASISLALSWATGDGTWDGIGSIAVGTVLVVVAVLLTVEVKSLLVGEAPSTDHKPVIDKLVSQFFPEGRVLRMIALQTGGNEVMLSLKLHPGNIEKVSDLVAKINHLEMAIKSEIPEIRWQFIEPDNQD